ncbi:MAG: sugar phosphorylase [Verrucomicrobia bacterium]|nr:sugar phosphorylase [Verrucomicrobiota bacterium]
MQPDKDILACLQFLYGEQPGRATWERLAPKLDKPLRAAVTPLTERDNLLITYGDHVTGPGQLPLQTLSEFLDQHTADIITGVHLLPHFPYSSDDGFSVIDYRQVNPALGTWSDVQRLGANRRLMLDAVINHISAQSAWFQAYRRGEPPYTGYFIEADPRADLSQVVRPRTSPVLTPVGNRHVWTTFSADQIDLNYRNPDVLLEMLDILLFYVANGAQFLRLDAIAYLWKEIGTSCIHLPQTHRIVQLIRAVLALVAPGVMLITETNVPHRDNISYFGDGTNEAHLVYNFPLPPLTLHALRTGNAAALSRWAAGLPDVTFFNFLASHDGIGLTPARGILTDSEIEALWRGQLVSHGSAGPYELNANYLDAIGGTADAFLCAQAIMLALRGLPGIYFHSLFGSRGWPEGVKQTGRYRTINRQKFTRAELERELADPGAERSRIFEGYRALLRRRAASPAFHPCAPQEVLDCGDAVFALRRTSLDGRQSVVCLHNVSGERQRVQVDRREVLLQAYEALWLTN